MRYRILGALRVVDSEGQPCLLDRRQSRILAVLLLSPNRMVSRDHLVDAVWDNSPPATAARQLQNCVSQLRQRLAGNRGKHPIVPESAGYRIRLEAGQLDAQVFEASVAVATEQAAAGRVAAAAAGLRGTLELWRGPALAGIKGRAIEAGSHRLDEQRLATLETCLELELAQGRQNEIIGELLHLVTANPLRERMVGLLMLALHTSGRRSEALQAYDRLRHHLGEELGLDPGTTLQELHASILRNSAPASPAAAPRRTAPRQLPVPARHFVGREPILRELDTLAEQADAQGGAIAVLDGTGGIGKTALAVRWAHRAATLFPDGQLFVNLRGFDPHRQPLPAATALRSLLGALGVTPEQIPADVDERASLYRSLLAERRMLIVLDNARDADQIRPLLPGGGGCMVVATSRNELTSLVAVEGARPFTLDLLSVEESRQLLTGRLGEERLTTDPQAVSELIACCARLPLALTIIAARAAAHPTFPLSTFSGELTGTQRRLDAVDGGDQFTQIRSVLSWSYQRLSAPVAQMFRLLGLHGGTDITATAAAYLAGRPTVHTRQLLTDLARSHMVNEHTMGRYAMHDLLSAYAGELVATHESEAERQRAIRRLLAYYLYTAAAADVLVTPHRRRTPLPEPVSPLDELPRFAGHLEALGWLETERNNLTAAVRLAHDSGEHATGWRLANLLWGLFHLGKYWDDWIATYRVGLACAQACEDTPAEFTMHSSLGTAYRELGRFAEARRCHHSALRISRRTADRWAEAQALNGLGAVYGDMRRSRLAQQFLRRSLQIRREIGDRWGEAITVCNLGEEDLVNGDLDSARHHFTVALTIRRDIGDRWGEAMTLSCLGQAFVAGRQYREALTHLSDALTMHREMNDLAMQASDLHHLGRTERELGHGERGEQHLREARAIYQRLGMAPPT
ncbi:BTAD domain-containing putative transcriptional regulator [Micromonospora sp. NPDC049060]|uniref:AfsR/SARP family transcriptional regulator n=1 Tax=Micromonospora sp. NPDC049060 TaxID=3154828 RepID=UPI003411A68E